MVTDITMDIVGVTSRSKKMGNASMAVALPIRRVTNRRWRFLRRGEIASANLRSRAVPLASMIARLCVCVCVCLCVCVCVKVCCKLAVAGPGWLS